MPGLFSYLGFDMSDKLTLFRKQYDFASGVFNDLGFENSPSYIQYFEEKQRLLDRVKKQFPLAERYLNCRLHDSRILSYKHIRSKFLEMTFNDYYFIDFAFALNDIEKLGMSDEQFIFPVTLKWGGLCGFQLYWSNRNNKLLPLRTRKYLPKIHDFLYDEIQEVRQNYVKMAMEYASVEPILKDPPYSKPTLYLQVVFEQISVQEQQKDSLYGLFDRKYYPLLDAFSAEIDKGTYFDVTVAGEFIKANQHLINKS
jgi:hypothetical protein